MFVNSHSSRVEEEPPGVGLQLESEQATMDWRQSLPENSECQSQLNELTRQQLSREVDVVTKESLADWGVVACVLLNNLITGIDVTGFGVFYPYLVEHFEATTAAVGWCSSIAGFFQAAVGK